MNIDQLKTKACLSIDERRDEIISIGETILRNPETGFREFNTERLVSDTFSSLGLKPESGLAITALRLLWNLKQMALPLQLLANWIVCVFLTIHLQTQLPARLTPAVIMHKSQE